METASSTPPQSKPAPSATSAENNEVANLRAEVEHLRALVGPSEDSYRKLRLDLLGARDAAIAAEAAQGYLRGQIVSLDSQLFQIRRDYIRFQRLAGQVLSPGMRRFLRQCLTLARKMLSGALR